MKYYTSGRNFTFKEAEKEFQTDAKCEMNLIKAYPKITYQEILGMGGALTESAAYTYAQMSPEKQKELLKEFYGGSGEKKEGFFDKLKKDFKGDK